MRQAYELHRLGQAEEAAAAYVKFLARYPRHGEALGNFGLLLQSRGDLVRALELFEQALALDHHLVHLHYFQGNGLRELGRLPEAVAAYQRGLAAGHDEADTLMQLGLTFFQQEDFSQAIHSFRLLLDACPDNINACFNLALCHKAQGRHGVAHDYLRQAHVLAPHDSDIIYNMGVLRRLLGDEQAAEAFFLQTLALNENNGICLTDLAILYHRQNRLEEARIMYQRALEAGYESESARHMLAALTGETTPCPPRRYVENLFDNFAESFEQTVTADLNYTVPTRLRELLDEMAGDMVAERAVDLGCGTGLSGQAFREKTGHLTGVDLSAGILRQAAAKQVYDDLHCADIIDYLHETDSHYDLALAADVFVYLGRLQPFFEVVDQSLNQDGLLLFSVESCENEYCLRQSGRFAHSPGYILELAGQYNFDLLHREPIGIRKERGSWIDGELYLLRQC